MTETEAHGLELARDWVDRKCLEPYSPGSSSSPRSFLFDAGEQISADDVGPAFADGLHTARSVALSRLEQSPWRILLPHVF
jgi:hypothetical protein